MKKISLLMLIIICAVAQEMRAQVSVWDGHSKEWPEAKSVNHYAIRNAAQFAWLIDHVGDPGINYYTYWLETDLDMGDRTWIPLGHRNGTVYDFDNVLNCQGHTIRINIDGATANYQGLFASISYHGAVRDLHLIGRISCSNSRLVGGIAGYNDGIIENCWVSADVSSGWREPASAYSAKVGGIAGENTGLIEYCCMTGNVSNNDACVGGLTGYNHQGNISAGWHGIVRHCTFYGSRSSSHSQDNRYVGSQGGTMENVYDRFDQGEYDSDGGRNVYRQAIKYPYALKIARAGSSTYVVNAGGEEGASATRAGETVTLTKSGTTDMVRVEIKDADGDDIGTGGNINGTLTFTMPRRDVYIKAYSWSDWPKQGSGTSDDPYLISNAEDWNSFANNVSLGRDYIGQCVKLTSDITVSTMAGGSEIFGFRGIFDGDGHTLTFNAPGQTEKFVAPFRCVGGTATIKNLKTAGSISSSNMYATGLVASIEKSFNSIVDVTIENCHSSMAISNSGSGDLTLSGLVGRIENATLTIRGCVFDGSLSGSGATGNAGFVSWVAPHSNVIVDDCLFAPSSLSTSTDLCATFARKDADASAEVRVTHSYYTRPFGTEQGTLAVTATTAPSTLGNLRRDYGMVTTYANGIFCDGTYYMAPTTLSGDGTAWNPYAIGSTYEWNSFVHHVNNGTTYSGKYVQLLENITVSTMVGGSESNPFSGTFLGNGHTITAAISDNSNSGTALFRYINGATIKDLKVAGTITGGIHAAAIVGIAKGTGNVIENCVATASVSGGTHIGGILGHGTSSDIAIRGCVFSGTMTGGGDAKGALFGWGDNGGTKSVTDCLYLMADGQNTDGLDLVRQWDGSVSVTNCYKSASVGSYGTLCFSVPTAPANLGTLKHDYGMMKAYENGILHNYTYYMAPAILAGSGTADNPYLIRNIYEWDSFVYHVANGQNYSGKYVKLTADIEITDVVGVYEGKPFSGTFLGEGHTLTANIRNTDSGKEGVAPFRYVKDATIRDVTVGGTIESNSRHVTGLVGFADGTNLIEGCTVNATLNISTDYAGGIIGHGLASATTIRNCVFAGTFNHVGGTPTNIGAIWGWSDSGKPVLENCLEKGTYKNVSSMHPMGLQKDAGSITNCYYLTPQIGSPYRVCTVSGACQVWPVPDNGVYKKITAADGKEYAILCTVGGVEARYNLADLSSITPVVTDVSGAALTLGTDYSATLNGTEVTAFPVAINTGGDYTLTITGKGAYGGSHSIKFSVIAPLTGSGTAEAPYLISTTADWLQLANTINEGKNYSGQYVKLTADIEISEMAGVYEGKPFSGTFLGEGHTLTANIKNTDSGKEGVAPFRYVKDATIRDVTVGGTIDSNGRHATGLVGFADGTNLIEGCTVSATLNISTDYAGGIVGHGLASATTIRNCVFAGTFNHVGGNPTNIGAIWGWSDSGKPVLENCLEKGTYKNVSSMHPMGLQNGTGTITNCYYLTPQIGSPDRACTVSGARQVWPAPYNGFYKKITAADGKEYAMPCTVGGVEASYYLSVLSGITPVVTDASGTTLALGTDYSATLNGTEVTAFPVAVNTSGDYTLTITGKGACGGSHSIKFSVIAPLTGSGTAETPYLISTTADWLQLSNTVNNGQSYSGQYVKLTADVEITEMAGVYEGKPFSGTFLGEGHTLTANIRNTDSGKTGVAPFGYVKDATIRDVTVGGIIDSNSRHTSGLVGYTDGTNLIEGCTVNATLNISTDYAGGIVGQGLLSATTIRNCIFAGAINGVGGSRANIGGIWGWSNSGKPVLENCLEKGTYSNISSMHPIGLQKGAGSITNCYYMTPQIGSHERFCTLSGFCQVSTTNTGDGIYRQVTLTDGTYYIVCYFSGVERRYLYTGSDITVAPTVTAADGTKLTAGTDFTYTPETVREMGDYTLTISGKGSYTGTKTFPISVSDQREVTSKSTVLTTGEYTVFEDVTIAERITIDGSVVLNLGENTKLKAPKGIELSKGNSLTINGPGSLAITDVEFHKSGIGAVEVGTLVINSGNIEITAITMGASLGGDKNNTSGGSITINGGKITIVGGFLGKCIGGGYDDQKGQYGVCGDIVINGGQLDLGSPIGFFGPGRQKDDVTYKSGTLTLGWTNPDDYIRTVNIIGPADDLSLERISFVEGRPFVLDGTTTVATADNIDGTKLVPLLALADNGDNSETLSRCAGAQLPVQLAGRTLYRDGSWNTLCLPFGVTLSGSPLEGATARPLTSASISGTTLNLSFGSAVTELVAGTPYIIKWAGGDNIVSPVFSPVTIDKTDRSYDNGAAGDARVRFVGTYSGLTFDSDDKSILFMGGESKLRYPAKGASIGAQRAYFCVGDFGLPSNARITTFNIDFGDGEATGIQEIVNRQSGNSKSLWYTLDGRRLDGKPMQSGVYINGGRKVVIK